MFRARVPSLLWRVRDKGVLLSYGYTWPSCHSLLGRYLAKLSFSPMEVPGQIVILSYEGFGPGFPSPVLRYLGKLSFSLMEVPGQIVIICYGGSGPGFPSRMEVLAILSNEGTWTWCHSVLWRYLDMVSFSLMEVPGHGVILSYGGT